MVIGDDEDDEQMHADKGPGRPRWSPPCLVSSPAHQQVFATNRQHHHC